jgi:type I restriction enzyme, S subunit
VEVRAGYKQTEVGIIPEDWEVDTLARYWNVMDCKHVTAQFIANGYPIASIREVQSRFVDLTSANQTTQKFYSLLIDGGRKPRAGDLILSRNATVGEVAQVAEWHSPFAMGQDVCLLRKKAPEFSTEFLQLVFRSPIIGNQLSDLMVGSTFKRANVQQIKNLKVPMPLPAEQEAIAEALSDADALIESLEQLLAKKRQLKQGAMQELLTGKKRLPGFEVKPGYKQTEAGVIPKDWEAMPFIRAVRSYIDYRGRTPRKLGMSWGGGDILALSANNVQMGRIDPDKEAYFGNDELYRKWMVQDECEPGDVLLTMEAPLGNVAQIPDSKKYILSQRVLLIKPKDWLSPDFLAYYMKGSVFQNQLSLNSTGTTAKGIQRRKLDELPVGLPPVQPEQTAIAAILSDMDAEIAALEATLAKASQLKQGMMQELLTGRIRLV